MEWSGRAPAPPAIEAGKGAPKTREHAMSQTLKATIAVAGIDIGKNSFHVVGLDPARARCGAASEVVAWPSGKRGLPICRRVPDRHGGVR